MATATGGSQPQVTSPTMSTTGSTRSGGDEPRPSQRIWMKAEFPFTTGRNKQAKAKTFEAKTAITELAKHFLNVPDLSVVHKEHANTTDPKKDALCTMAKFDGDIEKYFDIEPHDNKVNVYFTIHTALTFQEVKRHNEVWPFITKAGIFLRYVKLAKDKDSVFIGFITLKLNCTFTPDLEELYESSWNAYRDNISRETLKQNFNGACNVEEFDFDKPFPSISISKRPVRHTYIDPSTHKKSEIEIEAFHVSTRKEDKDWLTTILPVLTKDNKSFLGFFAPWEWTKKHPKTIFQICSAHKEWRKQSKVIPICGIHPKVMMAPRIHATNPDNRNISPQTTLLRMEGTHANKPKVAFVEASKKSAHLGLHFLVTFQSYEEWAINYIDKGHLEQLCVETGLHKKPEFQIAKFDHARRMDQKPYTTDRPEVDKIAEEILGVFKSDDEMDTTMTPPQPRRHQRQEVVVNLHKPIEPQQIPNFWHQPHHSTNTGRTTNGTYKAPGMQMDNPKGMLPYVTTPPNQYGPYYDFTGKGTLPPPASPWVINPAMHKEIEKLVRTTFDEKKTL